MKPCPWRRGEGEQVKRVASLVLFCVVATAGVYAAGEAEATYYPTSQVRQNDFQEITDEEIRAAFEAEPQIAFPLRVAWYNMGTDSLVREIEITRHEVESTYYIPKTLMEGYNADAYPGYSYPQQRTTLSLPAIRLAAARARCDVVILVGSSYEVRYQPNLLSVFNLLLVPLIFNPAFGITASYSAEMYVIDVRNEYLYGQISYDSEPERHTFLTLRKREKLVEELRERLMGDAVAYLSGELDTLFDRYRSE